MNNVYIRPDYPWATTFFTISGNKLQVYHNSQFTIDECRLVYYRQPRRIKFNGCADPYGTGNATEEVTCEFNDDLTEILIDEAASILNGDVDNFNQMNRLNQTVEKNN